TPGAVAASAAPVGRSVAVLDADLHEQLESRPGAACDIFGGVCIPYESGSPVRVTVAPGRGDRTMTAVPRNVGELGRVTLDAGMSDLRELPPGPRSRSAVIFLPAAGRRRRGLATTTRPPDPF